MIAPISSWAAAVSQYAADGEGISLFIMAIPFNFYSLLTIVFVVALILMKFDFGPMRKHELNALNGDLFSGKKVKQEEEIPHEKGRVFDLVLPIIFLLVASVFALVYVGGIFDGSDFITALSNTDATIALPWGGLVALIITIIYFALRKIVSLGDSMKAIPKGFIAMVPAILILTFATALKNMTTELGAAFFVGDLMLQVPSTLLKLVPAIIFVVACILSFATGTSWGTFGILIPIVMAMYPTQTADPLYIIGISACLAGAVCGDHCSPISDTTIMSSAGAECEHLNHVSTQLPYALYVAVASFVSFIFAGFIPYLSGSIALVDRYFFAPSHVDASNLAHVFNTGKCHNLSCTGFQEGYYATAAEMKKLFESNHFETTCIRSIRGFGYEKEDMIYQVKDEAVFTEIMKAIEKTAEDPAIVEMCGHAVYIGRKIV